MKCFCALPAKLALGLLVLQFLPLQISAGVPYSLSDVFGDNVVVGWSDDGQRAWYSVDSESSQRRYSVVDLDTGVTDELWNEQELLSALNQQLVTPTSVVDFQPRDINLMDKTVEFAFQNRHWAWDPANSLLTVQSREPAAHEFLTRRRRAGRTGSDTSIRFENRLQDPVDIHWISANGEAIKYASLVPQSKHNQHTFAGHLWSVRDSNGKELVRVIGLDQEIDVLISDELVREFDLLTDSRPGPLVGQRGGEKPSDQTLVRLDGGKLWRALETGQEELLAVPSNEKSSFGRPVISPDRRYVALIEIEAVDKRTVQFVEAHPRDGLQPKVHSLEYPKPGDLLDKPRLRIFDLQGGSELSVDNSHWPNPWQLSRLTWLKDSSAVTVLYNERGHQRLQLIQLGILDGSVSPIIDEQSSTFIDYAHKTYLHWLEGDQLLWMSERTGYNHIYRYDAFQGRLLNAVTKGDWVVREVIKVDEPNQRIFFSASGVFPDQDPYYRHRCRVQFDGTDLQVLTNGDGDHSWEFSPDGNWFVDRYSRVDMPPVCELRSIKNPSQVHQISKSNWQSLVDGGWSIPERFVSYGRDGMTKIYGIIVRPDDFQPGKAYPVVEKIYAGPHSSHVPKHFGLLQQEHELANAGFIVVRIDGMGTSNRGKRFHDVCWKNLADAGFPDRKLWIRAAAERYPEMDLGRVGIFGGSAGGQNAMRALLDHHDLYRVAVADCGCHDNRMDKIWWNEAWMGWPVDESYAQSSNVEDASRLEGKLLLIVGEIDQNVDPASTMQVVDALIRANKDFELLVMPSTGHGAAETQYGSHRRLEFLKRHLLSSSSLEL
ncbi:MAG: prolyl oligopeptidase family serine peptidase [Planctomycetales bacterium]|nr:prolyl oligopeptidase family serine peptidase [Planctomycetales bacterium]